MLRKKEIIDVLIDNSLSIIESERITDNKNNFKLAIEDIIEKAYADHSIMQLDLIKLKKIIENWVRDLDLDMNIFGVTQFKFGEKQLKDLIKRLKK